jgi:B12-binding domain/radical SAM domain protein
VKYDVLFIHAPSIYDFRERPIMFGPVSDVVPSTPIFEMYPIGFAILSDHLEQRNFRTGILNLAVRMLREPGFNVENEIRSVDTRLFALDLHWLPHAQGALEIARIIKKLHPDVPIVFGGLSSTYFHEELIKYPQVDMVMKGDSTEEPMCILLDVVQKGGNLDEVPNLSWKAADGTITHQPITYVPKKWDHSRINYGRIIKSALRGRSVKNYLPFKDFMRYPIVAAFFCRGGVRNCAVCGGSKYTYANFFNRPEAAMREPEDLAFDIADAASYFTGPVFLVGDVQAGGPEYIDRFLNALSKYKLKNMVVFEFWQLPPAEIFERISKAVANWSFEISCESQCESIRKKFGKAIFTNDQFKQSIKDGLRAGAQRADVYMMTGIPFQSKDSIMEIPDFVEYLYDGLNGERKKLLCFAAPLAPFVDPGSLAFEKPEMYGYTLARKSLEDHRQAMTAPSWKYWLNYDSAYLSRDDLVEATYDCGLKLNDVKRRLGVVSDGDAAIVKNNILKAKEIMGKIDKIYTSNLNEAEKHEKYYALKNDMDRYSMSTVCEKRELEWSVSALKKFKPRGLIKALLS